MFARPLRHSPTESSCGEDRRARVSASPSLDAGACVRDRALQLGVAAAYPDPSLGLLRLPTVARSTVRRSHSSCRSRNCEQSVFTTLTQEGGSSRYGDCACLATMPSKSRSQTARTDPRRVRQRDRDTASEGPARARGHGDAASGQAAAPVAQVLTIEPDQVDGVEPRRVAAIQQPRELWFTLLVEADDLAVEDRRMSIERVSDRTGELAEGLVDVPAP